MHQSIRYSRICITIFAFARFLRLGPFRMFADPTHLGLTRSRMINIQKKSVVTIRENRDSSRLTVNVTLVVANLYRHPVVSKHVSQTHHNIQLRFDLSGCAFGSGCHRPGFEPHRRRSRGEHRKKS